MRRSREREITPGSDQWSRLRNRSRMRVLVLIVVAVALLAATLLAPLMAPVPAPAAVPGTVLPDLVSDPPSSPLIQVYDFGGGNTRLLLRFTGYVHNTGGGALDMRGSARSGGRMTSVAQRLYFPDGVAHADDGSRNADIIFESQDGHDHWHLKDAAQYSLWNLAKTSQVAPAMKAGFCLEDSERVEGHGPSGRVYTSTTTSFCQGGNPGASSVHQGISAGWRDVYGRNLPFQWVDVSDVTPGAYYLRNQADPSDLMIEASESNNGGGFMSSSTSVPGYVAKPIAAGTFAVNDPKTITLDALKFGAPGARQFRIESGPSHGTLNRAVGSSFGGSTVTYTPERWYRGSDSFTYSALDSTSAFPRRPVRATVSFSVDGTGAGIALAAPAAMAVGTSAQVSASESNVTWSVDGAPGGGPLVGTITDSGLYTAPPIVPLAGKVTVSARSPLGVEGGVQIQIVPASPAQPAPAASDLAAPRAKAPSNAIGRPRITRNGRLLLITLRARRAGLVRVWAWNVRKAKRKKLGYCRAKTPRRTTMTCRVKLPPGVRTRDVQVTVSLRVKGKVVAVRYAGVRPARKSGHGEHPHAQSHFDEG